MATRRGPTPSNGRNGTSRAVARRAQAAAASAAPARIAVRKTYKLYVGGAFPRSESGRSYVVKAADGTPLVNAARASRKDLRDAVRAARKAFAGWAGKTAMNRGQVLYRVAELMEGRREQFVAEVARAEGLREPAAARAVDAAIDRWVWYAGWADKIGQVLGSSNPVAAPYFNFTIPEPTGVIGIVAPETSSLLGLVSRLAPPLVGEVLGRAMFGSDRVFNLTITNVRASAEPKYALGARMRSVLPYVPLFAGHSIGIAVVSYADGLVFGLGADRTRTPDLDVLAEGIETSFGELRRATSQPGSAAWAEHLVQGR